MQRLIKRFWPWAIALLIVAVFGFRFLASYRLQGEVERWAEARRAEGFAVEFTGLRRAGWPWSPAVHMRDVRLAPPAGTIGPRWEWRVAELSLLIEPWRPTSVRLEPEGLTELMVNDGNGPLAATLNGGPKWVRIGDSGSLRRLEIGLNDTDLYLQVGNVHMHAFSLDVAQRMVPPGDHSQASVEILLKFDELTTTLTRAARVEFPVDGLLNARVMGQIPGERLDTALAGWRDGGGTVEIDKADFKSGKASLSGSGTVALDSDMRPIGAFSTVVTGYEDVLQKLTESGLVTANDSRLAGLLLGALAKPGPDGRPTLTAPVSAQNGWLLVGPARLARLPRLVIPAP